MARNEEKAQSMLNRFLAAKKEADRPPKEKRPYLASECHDLESADKWRQQILKEIGRKVSEIQNPGLGEHRIRDLNDEINKLIREKGHWERRIVQLGGPNYARIGPKPTDEEGNVIDGATGKGQGYRYFGAAKTLPGVRELFEKPKLLNKKRNRYEMYKRIDADYYGYRDDEDGILEKLEKVAEQAEREKAVKEWQRIEQIKAEARKQVKSGEVASVADELQPEGAASDDEEPEDAAHEREFVAHVPLPDDKEIEKLVLQKKKAELLSKYASKDLIKEEEEAKALLNIKR